MKNNMRRYLSFDFGLADFNSIDEMDCDRSTTY